MTAGAKLALAIGDPAGIGPEIALKAALDSRVVARCRPLLVGDPEAVDIQARLSGITADISGFARVEEVDWARPGLLLLDSASLAAGELAIGEIRAAHGRAAIAAARAAIRAARAGHVDAVVAAPQTELAIKQAGIAFDGYPSFVARETGLDEADVFLMHCFDDKKIAHATLHVGLRRALDLVTLERVGKVIAATDAALKRMGTASPRLAVSGLNPHAGEAGLFGDEEIRIIGPAIQAAQEAGIRAEGPFGADTMFHRPGYDAFIVMYHDQGHITSKLLAPNRVAGLAIGAPVLFSSVAHGSALDIAGKNQASPEAVVEAVLRLVGAKEALAA
jgi:4-hydroxy-L-threonine phosphate dehydrogenase PdxA